MPTSSTGYSSRVATNRAQFYRDLPAGLFYGFNSPGVKTIEGIVQNWWRQGMIAAWTNKTPSEFREK
jgi:non-heme chloroperoxidase